MRTLTRESRQHLGKQIARFRPCIQSTRSAETIFGYSGALQHYRKARINLQQLVRMCAGISGRSGNIINSINYDFMAIALSLSAPWRHIVDDISIRLFVCKQTSLGEAVGRTFAHICSDASICRQKFLSHSHAERACVFCGRRGQMLRPVRTVRVRFTLGTRKRGRTCANNIADC